MKDKDNNDDTPFKRVLSAYEIEGARAYRDILKKDEYSVEDRKFLLKVNEDQ